MTTENKLVPISEIKLEVSNQEALSAITRFESNYADIKATLEAHLEHYRGLVYDDESIKDAKADKATLNKLIKSLDDERKKIQAVYEKPAKDFKKLVDELITLIKVDTVPLIGEQITEYEDGLKEKRKKLIKRSYLNIIPPEYNEQLPLDSIMDEKWLNQTKTMKQVEAEMTEIINVYRRDIVMINNIGGAFIKELTDKYKECRDMVQVTELKQQLDAAETIVKSKVQVVDVSKQVIPSKEVEAGNTSKLIRITGKDKSIDKFMGVLAKYCFDNKLDVDIIEE